MAHQNFPRLHSLVTVATACAPGPVGALLVEPEDAEHRTWTPMMPRAGVLILGPREQLQQLGEINQLIFKANQTYPLVV